MFSMSYNWPIGAALVLPMHPRDFSLYLTPDKDLKHPLFFPRLGIFSMSYDWPIGAAPSALVLSMDPFLT